MDFKITITYYLLIAALLNSCKNDQPEKLGTIPEKPEEHSIIVSVDTLKKSEDFFILVDRTFDYSQDHIYQLNRKKPSKITMGNWSQITVCSPNYYPQKIDVQAGDSILLGIRMDTVYHIISNRELTHIDDIIAKEEHRIISKIDSIGKKFYTIKYSDSLIVSNEYCKMKLFKMASNNSDPKINKTKDLKDLCYKYSVLIDDYELKLSENGVKRQRKIFLLNKVKRKVFFDLKSILKFWGSSDVINCMESPIFNSGTKIMGPTEREYLASFNNLYFRNDTTGGRMDLKTVYDSIPKHYSYEWVEKARMIVLEDMVSNGNNLKETMVCIGDFKKRYNNIGFETYINNNYLVDLKRLYNTKLDVNIVNPNLQVTSLKGLIDSLRGNLIYIDYWASWCSPCRAAMPTSIQLMNKYKDSNITFVYFSIDKSKDQWLKASRQDGILHYEHNYLILNHEMSNLKKELKIKTIPRYLIFDKNGALIHQNAPAPNTKNIKELFDKYLEE